MRVRVRVRARHRVRAGLLCLAALPEREVLQPLELRVEHAEMLACLTLTLTRSLPNPTPNLCLTLCLILALALALLPTCGLSRQRSLPCAMLLTLIRSASWSVPGERIRVRVEGGVRGQGQG